jgi:hypothetical protein
MSMLPIDGSQSYTNLNKKVWFSWWLSLNWQTSYEFLHCVVSFICSDIWDEHNVSNSGWLTWDRWMLKWGDGRKCVASLQHPTGRIQSPSKWRQDISPKCYNKHSSSSFSSSSATLRCVPWLPTQCSSIPNGLWPLPACFLFPIHLNPLQLCPSIFYVVFLFSHCATSRTVTGSIPDSVIGIFHWHNSFSRTGKEVYEIPAACK